jgi:alpha-L-rhamnosidase
VGAVVAEGWYSGYVGYGLLAGYGPNRVGRYFYGKTPALMAQMEIEYDDGSRGVVATGPGWRVTGEGPIREADLIMGEAYDARREMPGWDRPGYDASRWEVSVPAASNGSARTVFWDNTGAREVDVGFRRPQRVQAYAAPAIRVTEELRARQLTEPVPGVYIFDLGQNFAGIIRLRVKGSAGTTVRIRYGEMLHRDGRLMTENLRRARATDYYTLRGDSAGEEWEPRFTYHGFQYVELSGLAEEPGLEAVTGLVLHNDTPLTGQFACSDALLTRFWRNTVWTQRANFLEVPTDCPQRDERLGWMGDAQVYVRAASYNADVAAFFVKWLDDVVEAQRDFGAYPDYCPYPMGHGTPGKTFGTAWMDAGVICPWTVWQVYGDTGVIERQWESMVRFMDWRAATTAPEGLGVSIGNPWGDWLNLNDPTPVEFVDICYHALTCRMMAEMAEATGRQVEAGNYRRRLETVRSAFQREYLSADGGLSVDSQSALVLALSCGLVSEPEAGRLAGRLAGKLVENAYRMSTGFLGTKHLLPVLTAHGHQDLAVRLFQSRQFPSWGYEVLNGANTVWERWDSYTLEHGFDGLSGDQNASMNSFSHYAFGAVTEWMFRDLVGIDTEGPGFSRIRLRPGPPSPGSNPDVVPIEWASGSYESPRGRIAVSWRREVEVFRYEVTIPANTTATLELPATGRDRVREGGRSLDEAVGVRWMGMEQGRARLALESGTYAFESRHMNQRDGASDPGRGGRLAGLVRE